MPLILALGLTGVAAHYCLARSMALADASIVIPMEFLRLGIKIPIIPANMGIVDSHRMW